MEKRTKYPIFTLEKRTKCPCSSLAKLIKNIHISTLRTLHIEELHRSRADVCCKATSGFRDISFRYARPAVKLDKRDGSFYLVLLKVPVCDFSHKDTEDTERALRLKFAEIKLKITIFSIKNMLCR
ncbi:hypothetical protein, partial [Sodaliphilus sp.]|uniref:hypothetical protein n=1 Tax=Sodaliphilus sp. TaxID=2815818 RepID=UPI003890CC27